MSITCRNFFIFFFFIFIVATWTLIQRQFCKWYFCCCCWSFSCLVHDISTGRFRLVGTSTVWSDLNSCRCPIQCVKSVSANNATRFTFSFSFFFLFCSMCQFQRWLRELNLWTWKKNVIVVKRCIKSVFKLKSPIISYAVILIYLIFYLKRVKKRKGTIEIKCLVWGQKINDSKYIDKSPAILCGIFKHTHQLSCRFFFVTMFDKLRRYINFSEVQWHTHSLSFSHTDTRFLTFYSIIIRLHAFHQ